MKGFLIRGFNANKDYPVSIYRSILYTEGENLFLKTNEGIFHLSGSNSSGENINLDNYYTKLEMDSIIDNSVDLDGYATEAFVVNTINAIEIPEPNLSNYYNIGEVDTLIDGVEVDLMINTTHADLLALVNNSGLTPGQQYRITDYVATVDTDVYNPDNVGFYARSNNHAFDIIVTADSTNKLNENARAIRHEGDTHFPLHTKFEVWKLKYTIFNDSDRFSWAVSEGKGVVYQLIDEFNNDLPYDFKSIQFQRDSIWVYTFGGEIDGSLEIYNCRHNTILNNGSSLNDIVFGNYCYSNTFGDFCSSNTFGNYCYSNTFGNYCISNTFGDSCTSNTFGSNYNSNTFGRNCSSNTFGSNCGYNTFGYNCGYNTFGDNCGYNTFGDNCTSNTFGRNCSSNTFGSNYNSNTFGDNCTSNTFGDYCYGNTFRAECSSNEFGQGCNSNTFGDNCNSNTFGDNCTSNTFELGCNLNDFGNSCNQNSFRKNCGLNTFELGCGLNTLGANCTSNTFGQGCNSNTFGDICNSNNIGSSCYSNTFGNSCNQNTIGTGYINYNISSLVSNIDFISEITNFTTTPNGNVVNVIKTPSGVTFSQVINATTTEAFDV